jgi:hypothetical protein
MVEPRCCATDTAILPIQIGGHDIYGSALVAQSSLQLPDQEYEVNVPSPCPLPAGRGEVVHPGRDRVGGFKVKLLL